MMNQLPEVSPNLKASIAPQNTKKYTPLSQMTRKKYLSRSLNASMIPINPKTSHPNE
jgi:hypothetical protein